MESTAPTGRRAGYQSAPFAELRQRTTLLHPELRALGLERHVADLAMDGYTVVPPDKALLPDEAERLLRAVLRVSERRTGVAPDEVSGDTHRG